MMAEAIRLAPWRVGYIWVAGRWEAAMVLVMTLTNRAAEMMKKMVMWDLL